MPTETIVDFVALILCIIGTIGILAMYDMRQSSLPALRDQFAVCRQKLFFIIMAAAAILSLILYTKHGLLHATFMYGFILVLTSNWLSSADSEQPAY